MKGSSKLFESSMTSDSESSRSLILKDDSMSDTMLKSL